MANRWQIDTFVGPTKPVEIIKADKWVPLTNLPPRDIPRQQYSYPSFWVDAKQLTQLEKTQPDKWLPLPNQPPPDIKRQQHTYPSSWPNPLAPEATPVTVGSVPGPHIVYEQLIQYQSLANVLKQFVAETITMDKWYRDLERPPSDLERRQYAYPSFWIDANQLAQPEKIFPDKWHPRQNQPLGNVTRRNYESVFAPLTVAEAITLDKWYRGLSTAPRPSPGLRFDQLSQQPISQTVLDWYRELSQPRWDVGRGYTHPSFWIDTKQLLSNTSPDRWHPLPNQPRFDLLRLQYLYPCTWVDPNLLTQHETVFPDKWHPEIQRPVWDLKKQQFSYPFSFLNPQAPEQTAVASSTVPGPHIVYEQVIQYQSLANVLQQFERVTPDKWHPEVQRPPRDLSRLQFLYPTLFWDGRYPPDFSLVSSWFGALSVPTPPRARMNEYPSTFWPSEMVLPDRWQPETQRPRWDLDRRQFLYPYLFWDPTTPIETITVDKWVRGLVGPLWDLKRQQYTYPCLVQDANALAQPETVFLDKWFQQLHLPPRDLDRMQYFYPTLTTDLKQVFPDGWQPRPNNPLFDLKRLQYLYPTFWGESREPLEQILADRWYRELSRPVWDVPRLQVLYPTTFVDLKQVSPDSWQPLTNLPPRDLARLQHEYPNFWIDPNLLTQPETPFVDKWFHELSTRLRDVDRQQFTNPSSFWDSSQLAPEVVTMDKWFREAERPVWDLIRAAYLFPWFITDPNQMTVPEVIYPDKWFRELSLPVWDLKRQQYLDPSFVIDAQEPNTSADRWWRDLSTPVWLPSWRGVAASSFFWNPTKPIETITMDKWFREWERPQWNLDRRYVYPFPFYRVFPQLTAFDWYKVWEIPVLRTPWIVRVGEPWPDLRTLILSTFWFPQTELPPRDILRAQFGYPFVFWPTPTIPTPAPPGAPRCTLTASALTIPFGQSVTLAWSTTQSPTFALLEPSVGAVNPAGGSVTVSPSGPTVYTLIVANQFGVSFCLVSINVTGGPCSKGPQQIPSKFWFRDP